MDLLKPRANHSFGRVEAVVLGLYTLLIGYVIFHHEPWGDEAQAWLIARDSSFAELFLKRLHYEGTPGLWHLLLWMLCRLHLSYAAMHWLSALLGIAAIYLLLRYSPFPPLVRAVLPFCFSLVFLTAIIARSYSLVPVIAFAACAILTGKRDKPVLFAVLTGLLANTSAFAFLVALGLVPLYLLRPGRGTALSSRGRVVLASAVFMLLLGFAAYTALPAPDMTFGLGEKLASHPAMGHLLSDITGISLPSTKQSVSGAIQSKEPIDLNRLFLARHANHHLLAHMVLRIIGLASVCFFAVSQSNLLAFFFYAALLWWLYLRRSLSGLLPLLVLLMGGHFLGIGERHMVLVTTVLIIALWLGWSRPKSIARRSELLFQIILLAVLVEQAAWSVNAAIYDIRQPFDGSVATAHFILPKASKNRIANIAFDPLAILPYTSHNVFFNQETTFWPWEQGRNPDLYIPQTVAEHPDFILDAESVTGDTLVADQVMQQALHDAPYDPHDKAAYLREHGYHETHRFCGNQPAHFGFYLRTCDLIYEPSTTK